MVATAIYSVTMVFWKETAFHLCRATERRWKRNVVSRVSSVTVVIRLPISCELCGHLTPCTGWFYGKWVEDVLPWSQNTPRGEEGKCAVARSLSAAPWPVALRFPSSASSYVFAFDPPLHHLCMPPCLLLLLLLPLFCVASFISTRFFAPQNPSIGPCLLALAFKSTTYTSLFADKLKRILS